MNCSFQDTAPLDPLSNQQCRVCDEPAAGFHFGAFTCEGCKSFFGRTCNNQSVIQECKNNFRCVVDKKNRTACKACRLRKCLMVGMSKSGSRYGRRSNWFKIHCLMQNGGGGQVVGQQEQKKSSNWPPKSEGSVGGEARDCSFTSSSSRSPSPTSSSPLDSLRRKGSPVSSSVKPESPFPSSPLKQNASDLDSHHPLHFTSSSTISPLYSSPISNPFLNAFAPFYKLSPLLGSNPHPLHLLMQLQGQRSQLDLLTEQRQLLDKLRMQQHLNTMSSSFSSAFTRLEEKDVERMEEDAEDEDDRAVSPPQTTTDSPIDLSVKFSTTPILLPISTPTDPPLSPQIEVDVVDKSDFALLEKSDSNQNLLSSKSGSAALDLTVSS